MTSINGCDSIITLSLLVNENYQPNVSWNEADSVVCEDAAPVFLTASPWGGVYSGSGIDSNYFNPAAAGLGPHIISYVYTNTYGCSAGTAKTFIVLPLSDPACNTATGLSNLENLIFIYPNPTNDIIHIYYSNNNGLRADVLDINGQMIISNTSVDANHQVIDLSKFSSGVYLLRIRTKDGDTLVKKVVKE